MFKLLIYLACSFCLISCNKNEITNLQKNATAPEKITILDIDFNADEDDKNIFLYLRMQEEYALTLKQFNNLFNYHLIRTGLDRRIESGEIPKNNLINIKQDFFMRLINSELLYQDGLRTPEMLISPAEIEKNISKEMLKNNKARHLTFDEFLAIGNFTHQEFYLKIKKELYIKKVMSNQMKFISAPTPSEIEDLYLAMAKAGRFSEKFREVYLIEYPSSMTPPTDSQINEIKDLTGFQFLAREESIHSSAKKYGQIEDVPYIRSLDQKRNKERISNLFFDDLWQYKLGVANYLKIDDRQFLIWVNKEFEKQNQMTMEIQQNLIRVLNNQKRIQHEQNYIFKIASSFSFKVRYKNELLPLDLKKFFQNSILAFQNLEQPE